MKTVLGYLALILGSAGLILSVAAGILGWWYAAEFAARTNSFATQADDSLARVNEILTRVEKKVSATGIATKKVRESATRIADGKVSPKETLTIDRLLQALAPLLERTSSFGESLQSIGVVLESAAGFSEHFGKDKSQVEQLRSIAGAIKKAADTLDAIQKRFTALQSGEVPPTARELADLAGRAQNSLDQFAGRLEDVRFQSEELQAKLTSLKRLVEFWTVYGPIILTAILIWIALGQACLIGWGWRQVAARKT